MEAAILDWCIFTNWILGDVQYVFRLLILNCLVLYVLVIHWILIDLVILMIKILKKNKFLFSKYVQPIIFL